MLGDACYEIKVFLDLLMQFIFKMLLHPNSDEVFFLLLKGISPDVVTYSTLMKACIRARKFDQVPYILLFEPTLSRFLHTKIILDFFVLFLLFLP